MVDLAGVNLCLMTPCCELLADNDAISDSPRISMQQNVPSSYVVVHPCHTFLFQSGIVRTCSISDTPQLAYKQKCQNKTKAFNLMFLCHIRLLHCSSRQKQQHSKILNEQGNGKGQCT